LCVLAKDAAAADDAAAACDGDHGDHGDHDDHGDHGDHDGDGVGRPGAASPAARRKGSDEGARRQLPVGSHRVVRAATAAAAAEGRLLLLLLPRSL
jgi:hypothetical protein